MLVFEELLLFFLNDSCKLLKTALQWGIYFVIKTFIFKEKGGDCNHKTQDYFSESYIRVCFSGVCYLVRTIAGGSNYKYLRPFGKGIPKR